MEQLRLEAFTMSAAELGAGNPFPQLISSTGANAPMKVSPEIPEENRKYFGYGINHSILPYSIQDGYDRARKPRMFRAIVLENEILRATFLPEIGGRLWSLFHKPAQRELLYVNPVFQPANLAVRNAWFSGGVEWNMSMAGHNPFTCEPLFAAQLKDENGSPILRMYEWERLRGLLFQLDISLPSGSPVLLVRVRLVNSNPFEIPTYWWSNIAVPESPGQRVIAPTDWAMSFGYGGTLERVSIPRGREGVDLSYPTNIRSSNDFFFHISEKQRPWIASLDEGGRGLFQTSTARLRGRKLFVWGMDSGGRRWQEFLSEPNKPYVEIQAGLGRTQAECVPMPANADWSWIEAYGLLEAEAETVHGSDWGGAVEHVRQKIGELVSEEFLEARLQQTAALADAPPEEMLQAGSGWGALENLRRAKSGGRPLGASATPFPPESLGKEQAPWKALLGTGQFPEPSLDIGDRSWVIGADWRGLLENAASNGSNHYESWLQLGVMYFSAGQMDKAREAWERSISFRLSVVALRNLSLLAAQEGRSAERLTLIEQARLLAPEQLPLVIECLQAFRDENQPEKAREIHRTLSPQLKDNGRIKLIVAQTLLQLGELEKVRAIMDSEWEVADLKEGDNAFTNLWFEYQERRLAAEGGNVTEPLSTRVRREFPPPQRFDFRMRI